MSENIDKIIYINLNKRIDRRAEIEQELNAFNLPFERFEAIATPGFGILGCGQSHLAVSCWLILVTTSVATARVC